MTKELKKLLDSIEEWVKANKGNVIFIASFMAFNEKRIKENADDVFKKDENRIAAYGEKESLEIMITELQKMIKKEKGNFISW